MKVTKEVARERERQAWDLRQQNWTLIRIARELKVSESAICQILQRVSRRVLGKLAEDVEQVKREQTARLERLADEVYQEWTRSKGPKKTVIRRTTKGEGEDAPVVEETTTQSAEEQIGDMGCIDRLRDLMADVRKIWGADAPIKTEGRLDLNDARKPADLSNLTDEQLTQLADLLGHAEAPSPPAALPG